MVRLEKFEKLPESPEFFPKALELSKDLLHLKLRKAIDLVLKARGDRAIYFELSAVAGVPATVAALGGNPFAALLAALSGATFVEGKNAHKAVVSYTENLNSLLTSKKLLNPIHRTIDPEGFDSFTEKALKNYCYAFVKKNGNLVLTNKEYGAKILGIRFGRKRFRTS